MASEPPEPRTPHQARTIAESFGLDAELYDRTRPRYPDALVQKILAAGHGSHVLDVGCGSGIVARPFLEAGSDVLGVDPDERMASFARHRGLEVEVSTFESWDAAGRQFDFLVAGQSWHWVDPMIGAARAAEVLRPGGRLALFWYVFEPPPALKEAFSAIYQSVLPGTPFSQGTTPGLDGYSAIFARASDGLAQTGKFRESAQWRFDWGHSYTRGEWLEQVPTFGGHSQLPPAQLQELLVGIGAAIDAVGGTFSMHYIAVAVTAERAEEG